MAQSVFYQLPFFSCPNIILKNEYQNDIKKYLYCKGFGISPYRGSYGEQPALWVEKTFVMNNAINNKEKRELNKMKKKNG